MSSQKVLGSYLLRITEEREQQRFSLHDLKTGEVLEFETWVSAWWFLEHTLNQNPSQIDQTKNKS